MRKWKTKDVLMFMAISNMLVNLVLVGVMMATVYDVVNILGKNLNPTERAVVSEYFNQLDSTRASFTGGGTLSVETLEANTAAFREYPFEGARVMRDATQTISHGTYTDVIFDTVSYQSFQYGKLFDPSVSTTRLTIQRAGIYCMGGDVRFAASDLGTMREVWIYSNRQDDAAAGHIAMSHVDHRGTIGTAATFFGCFEFTQGDWVSLRVWQDTGGDLNIDNARFNIFRIR